MFKWFKSLFKKKEVPALPPPAPAPKMVSIPIHEIMEEIQKAMSEDIDFMDLPFTTAENYAQVQYEMESVNIDSEYWSDKDYIEHLLGYTQQGYNFEGLMELYKKAEAGKDLSEVESKKLKDWYTLVAVDIVYET